MFRRCVSILVLLGFVAGQLAVVPHAHGSCSPDEQRKHDARPHVHVGTCGHSHDHDHSDDGHSDSHPTDKASAARVEQLPNDDCARRIEHDADAFYFPSGATSSVAVKDQRTVSGANPIRSADSGWVATCFLAAQPHFSALHRPPNDALAGAKLFLTLRHLRI